MIAALVIFGAILFLAAGRLYWIQGWVYLEMNALTQALSAIVLIPRRPGILAERSQVRAGTKASDQFLAPAIVVAGALAVLITAGLDARFGRSGPIRTGLWWFGLMPAFTSQMSVLWTMASNPFFATTVRIQEDRGNTVTRSGRYQFVRQPGYAGSLIYKLVIPLVQGSWWTFIPALLTIARTLICTQLGDRTLRAELSGYGENAAKVGYGLIPAVS